MSDDTNTPAARPVANWTLYIHSGMDRKGAWGGGLFECVGHDLWKADDGWTHRSGFYEQPTPLDAPHPATGTLWKAVDMGRETGSITAIMLRPAAEDELPLIRERAAWERRRSAACDAWHAISYDDYPAKRAVELESRAIEFEHLEWLPEWQRKCVLQTVAEEAAIPRGIPEPAEWSLYIEGVDRQEAYGGGLYRCMGRREWRADAGWSHFDTPTPPDAQHPARGSLWMVSGMKPDSRDLRTVVQLLPASPADAARIRERAAREGVSHHD